MVKDIHPLAKFRFCPSCGAEDFVVHTEKSKRCGRCGFTYFLNPSASTVAVIENERGEVLVVRRAKEPAMGTLDLPGGFSDCGETSEEGVVREVMEETGLRVDAVEFLFSLPNVYPFSGFDVHTLDMFYLCHVDSTKGAVAADDAAELMWMPWEQIRPEAFGLCSIRKGAEKILFKKNLNK